MDNEAELLQVKELCVRRETFALQDISFSVSCGEMLAILGKTGAGKTLLLESVAGFYRPAGGNVLLKGKNVVDIPIHKRNIGYLYQDYCLFPKMTARDNIGYGLKMRKQPKEKIRENVDRIAERFGITYLLDQFPTTLSGGEQQRVAFARALILQPDLLLLDEPFSALDPRTQEKMYRMIQEIRSDFRCGILFVTHNFAEAQTLADRIGILVRGRLCGIVPCAELYDSVWEPEAQALLGLSTRQEKSV